MNSIRQIQELNRRELETGVSPEASWHADYRDTAYIYIGGLPFELSEGDVITIFSQFGEPTYVNLVRDKETGKSKGFAFLKYEDQRSTDLAVDNLGGAVIMGRTLKVDHTRYKKKDDETDEGEDLTTASKQIEDVRDEGPWKRRRKSQSEPEEERPLLKEERELAKLLQEHDEDDPMKAFLVQEKKEEVALALARVRDGKRSSPSHKHRHHHRSRREKDEGEDSRRSHHRKDRGDHEKTSSPSKESSRQEARRRTPAEREVHQARRRSPRRDGRERFKGDLERDSESTGKREGSRDGGYHRSRRDS